MYNVGHQLNCNFGISQPIKGYGQQFIYIFLMYEMVKYDDFFVYLLLKQYSMYMYTTV